MCLHVQDNEISVTTMIVLTNTSLKSELKILTTGIMSYYRNKATSPWIVCVLFSASAKLMT
jgi:hypothetical protein